MPSIEPGREPPLHPVREGGGFLRAIARALLDMIRPRRHRRRPGGPLIDDEVQTITAEAADKISRVAPYPTND